MFEPEAVHELKGVVLKIGTPAGANWKGSGWPADRSAKLRMR